MISKIFGKLDNIAESSITLELSGFFIDVLIPPYAVERLNKTHKSGDDVLLYTKFYIEAGMGGTNMIPRLIGFLEETDSKFFNIYTTVKGLGDKKALKSLVLPINAVASMIENSDIFKLKKLPGIGGRMADKIVAELKGKVMEFASGEVDVKPGEDFHKASGIEEEAMEVLITQLGYRRVEAENMLRALKGSIDEIDNVEDLLQAVFSKQTQ